MSKLIQLVLVVLFAVGVWEADAQRCVESNREYMYKIANGCEMMKITPKECLREDWLETEQQAQYKLEWDDKVLYSDDDCKIATEFDCGQGKVKTEYTTCSSQFCDAMKDVVEADQRTRECSTDDDCNVDGTLKVEKKICLKVGEDLMKKICDLTDTEIATQLETGGLNGGLEGGIGDGLDLGGAGSLSTGIEFEPVYANVPNADDCAKPDDDGVCFDRDTTTACRRIDHSTSPAEAYEACFRRSSSAVAERVLMRHLRSNDWVLSAEAEGKGLFFDRVLVNQHLQNPELRSRTLVIFHDTGFLSVTPDHLLPMDGLMQPASVAAVGMTLLSPSGQLLPITHIRSEIAGIINPITTTGTILAASLQGSPVVASTYSKWAAAVMSFRPLPYSLINWLSSLMPSTAQSLHDAIIEPFVLSSPLPTLLENVSAPVAIASWVVCDIAMSALLVLFFFFSTLLQATIFSPLLLVGSCMACAVHCNRKAKAE